MDVVVVDVVLVVVSSDAKHWSEPASLLMLLKGGSLNTAIFPGGGFPHRPYVSSASIRRAVNSNESIAGENAGVAVQQGAELGGGNLLWGMRWEC